MLVDVLNSSTVPSAVCFVPAIQSLDCISQVEAHQRSRRRLGDANQYRKLFLLPQNRDTRRIELQVARNTNKGWERRLERFD
jgi:hypothetical protein